MAERTAWRICSDNRWWSVFGKKKRGKNGKTGPPVHDDLVTRDFTAPAPNTLWLADITGDGYRPQNGPSGDSHRFCGPIRSVALQHHGWWPRASERGER